MAAETQATQVCSICWVDLPYENVERAEKFYSNVFGWSFEREEGNPVHVTAGIFAKTEETMSLAGLVPKGEGRDRVVNYYQVPSLEQWKEKVKAEGGRVIVDRREVGNYGVFAVCEDTEGNRFAMWEPAPSCS